VIDFVYRLYETNAFLYKNLLPWLRERVDVTA